MLGCAASVIFHLLSFLVAYGFGLDWPRIMSLRDISATRMRMLLILIV